MKLFKNLDFQILLGIFVLSILGLSMIWSLVPNLFLQQFIFFIIGFFVFFLFAKFDFRVFENLSWMTYGASISLLILTLLIGEVTRGSVRWIRIGSLTIQPSEIIKPFLIIFFASVLAKEEKISPFKFVKVFLLLSLPLFFVFKQPDFGSSLVIFASFLGILFAGGLPIFYIISSLLVLGILSPIVWILLKDYQKERILSFLNPYHDPLGSGYHLIQSVITVGSGMIFGRGLGRGTQSQLAFLPEHHTDFIFASLSEELGFLGATLLIFSYFLILYRILKIAQSSPTNFGTLLCFGVFSLLIFQIFINIGMNLGMLPITGITLPLVSYGGSSILATMISLGIVESVARRRMPEGTIEIR